MKLINRLYRKFLETPTAVHKATEQIRKKNATTEQLISMMSFANQFQKQNLTSRTDKKQFLLHRTNC